MSNFYSKKTAISCAVLIMISAFFSGRVNANQLCMSSKIKSLKLINSTSELHIQPEESIYNPDLYTGGKYIAIWQKTSYARWSEKYSLIKMAYALNSKIEIYSNDWNCSGNQDEFTIELIP